MNKDDNIPTKKNLNILKIKEEELWLEEKMDSEIIEFHFEPK